MTDGLRLAEAAVTDARAWADTACGCTCRLVEDAELERPRVTRHDCPVCRDWGRRLARLGIATQARELTTRRWA